MIKKSHFRRLVKPRISTLVLLALAIAGCSDKDRTCGLMGCREGLNVHFSGVFEVGRTYAVTLAVVTSTPETVPFMDCTVTTAPGSSSQFRCASGRPHTVSGTFVSFPEYQDLNTIHISVSSQEMLLGEATYTPNYTHAEINGEGCGVCSSGTITVDFPARVDAGA